MPSKTTPAVPHMHPPLGTLIDDDSLELAEVLGVGGYGVVYRAEESGASFPKSYAVKCLFRSHQSSRQRQVHIREVALHQIASAHPNVVSLYKVVEDYYYTYIIMEYAPDHDLFTQILHHCRYLGDDQLIRHVFNQLLDAVEYTHALGIYHRDLKPENILCFDGGLRVAITDFGLATTDKLSEEFRTGSIYHMSPECQGGEFAPNGTYSPMFNDIWSLGIILLNLATGRNPWKSACASDPTFQAYLQDPANFLPTVLPISDEANALLTRMLELDWRDRMTIPEIRQMLDEISTFYSEGAIFEGSMARCPWEAGMDIESSTTKKESPIVPPPRGEPKSRWSSESNSDIVFASHSIDTNSSYGVQWGEGPSCSTWAAESVSSIPRLGFAHDDSEEDDDDMALRSDTPESDDIPSPSISSFPSTPSHTDPFMPRQKVAGLKIDTDCQQFGFYGYDRSMMTCESQIMHTAVDYDPYTDSLFLTSASSPTKLSSAVESTLVDPSFIADDRSMLSESWDYPDIQSPSPAKFSASESFVQETLAVERSAAPSPDTVIWPDLRTFIPSVTQHNVPHSPIEILHVQDIPSRTPSPSKKKLTLSLNPAKSVMKGKRFFPLSLPPSSVPSSAPSRVSLTTQDENPLPSFSLSEMSPTTCSPSWVNIMSPRHGRVPRSSTFTRRNLRRPSSRRSRSPRNWFLAGKLFASTAFA